MIDYALEPLLWTVDQSTRLFGKACGFVSLKLYDFAEKIHEISEELAVIDRFVEENL